MTMSTFLVSLSPNHPKPPQNSISRNPIVAFKPNFILSRRLLVFTSSSLSSLLSLALQTHRNSLCFAAAAETSSSPSTSSTSSVLSGIASTKSWYQFFGDGFAIRVPPQFEDIMEPEDYNAGLSLYGDKAKPRTFAARFASSDGSEVLSVVIRPSNQLKITFLEAKDITDLGSLKEAAKIFVPATLYSARAIKIKEDEGFRTYYYYEFGRNEQHIALMAAINSGKAIIAGATAPQYKWDDDGVKLRSAAISLTVL